MFLFVLFSGLGKKCPASVVVQSWPLSVSRRRWRHRPRRRPSSPATVIYSLRRLEIIALSDGQPLLLPLATLSRQIINRARESVRYNLHKQSSLEIVVVVITIGRLWRWRFTTARPLVSRRLKELRSRLLAATPGSIARRDVRLATGAQPLRYDRPAEELGIRRFATSAMVLLY